MTLNAARAPAVDLSPLAGLAALGFLDIADSPAADLTPVTAISTLEHLELGAVSASQEPLRHAENLTWVSLRPAAGANLSALRRPNGPQVCFSGPFITATAHEIAQQWRRIRCRRHPRHRSRLRNPHAASR